MSDKVFIAPRVAGEKCPLAPEDALNGRRHVAPEGETVPDRIFYERLERDGSLFRGVDETDVKKQREKAEAEHKAARAKVDAMTKAKPAAKTGDQ